MRREIIQCEICKKEHDAQYELPKEWITTKQTGYPGNDIEQHFCSRACIAKWTGTELQRNEPPPTKMRRFLLVTEERDIEGVRYANGAVGLDPEQAKQNDVHLWFYDSWDDFKRIHDGSGIQWIDQEVTSQDKGYPGYHPPRSTHPSMSITGLRGDKPLEIKADQEVSSAD